MRRTLFVLALAAAVAGMTGYAQVRTGGPSTFIGGGYMQIGSVRVTADHMVVKSAGASSTTANATATRPDAVSNLDSSKDTSRSIKAIRL